MTEAHEISLDHGMYWCHTEDCDADECEDENRCSYGCVCNTRPDFDMTEKLSGKVIDEVLEGRVPSAHGAEPTTILIFEDGSKMTFVHPQDED